jgi:hypothetical protein
MGDEQRPDTPYLYDAFISYRHVERDRKWAAWLIDALERYRVPKNLQDKGLPPRLRKVFRDEDEVPASSDLNDQIKDALAASRFLIVICSAFTPRSKWVEREIEIFNELGRGDQVLALLTEGEPGDSFPSAMLVRHRRVVDPDGTTRIVKEDKEPLAADVRPRKGQSAEELKRLALLRLVATILGVKFDDLRQREQERERHGKLVWAAAAAALVVVIGGLGLGYWEMMRPSTTYYRESVWRRGVPEGLGAIDENTRKHRGASYGVTVRRDSLMASPRVVEMRRENSAGKLVGANTPRGEARWVIRYRDDGAVERIQEFDAADRLLREDVIRPEAGSDRFVVSFERNNVPVAREGNSNRILDPSNAARRDLLAGRTEITREIVSLDANGFIVERRYQGNWRRPKADAQGSFGQHFTNSPEGLVLRSAEIDSSGAEITLKDGVRAVVFAYDQQYDLTRYTLLGADGRPIIGPSGFAYYERQSDRFGNDVAIGYYDPDGRATLHKDGYARYAVTYDDRGFQTGLAYYGLNGERALIKNGYASFQWITNDRGYVVEQNYFGVDGKPTVIRSGVARIKQTRDDHGQIIEESYFDIAGKPTLINYGEAIFRNTFDRRGNLTTTSYFGADGEPTTTKDGFSKVQLAYDDRDNNISAQYFDVHGKPTLIRIGAAKITQSFDARGNLERIAVFGVDNEPVLYGGGQFAAAELTRDDRGNIVGVQFFGVDGKPAMMFAGVAGYRATFDDHGNEIERTNLGVDGNPKLNNEGVATYKYKRDARGNILEGLNFDVDGQPILSAFGNAIWRNRYDDRGNRVELAYFGLDGKPTLGKEGFATIRYSYDARGHEIERAFFGVDGKPTLISSGIAGFRQTFDARGNKVELNILGVDGKPILNSDGLARISYRYDARGNEIERAFFGVDGTPTLGAYGFARVVWDYDTRSHQTAASYFGVKGEPVVLPQGGYSKIVWVYDVRGYLLEEAYFGADGKPLSSGGCVKISYAYDNVGGEIGATCIDTQYQERQIEIAVSKVSPGFAGARAGLAVGDKLLTYKGQKVTSIRRFYDLVADPLSGFRILVVRRGAQVLNLSVPAGDLGIGLVVVPVNPAETPPPAAQAN